MGQLSSLHADRSGAAAAELALITPLLLIIMFGSLELGNYFMNEHTLVKAVRDGARFAARQSFTNYPDCSTVSTTARDNTRNVVMNGALSGGTIITPNIEAEDIEVTTSCVSEVGESGSEVNMSGIYAGRADGAQIVTVSATVAYRPVLSSVGFSGIGLNLNAASQAAVAGL